MACFENRESQNMNDDAEMQNFIAPAQSILEELLRMLEFEECRISATVEDGHINFHVVTSDAGRLIGRTSQNLDALQFLLNRILSRKYENPPYCVVDVEGYRERRRMKLLEEVRAALERVRETGRPWRMPPLHAMERRIIHQALKDEPDVQTSSEAEEPDGRKRVVISPVTPPAVSKTQEASEPAPPAPPSAS